jgi:ribose transport system permease protein
VNATKPAEALQTPAEPAASDRRRQGRVARTIERFALLVAWVVVIVFFSLLRPDAYPTWGNFSTILGSQAVLVVITLGLMIPLTAGDFDLSVASVLMLSQMLIGILNVQHGWPIGLAIAAAVALSAVIGLINAGFILFFRIPSLIVTLGTGTFINGIVLWISASQTVGGISDNLVNAVIVARLFGIPLAFYYGLALSALVWYVFEFTALGRRLLFVGRGREVARLSGIRVDRVRMGCLVASSMFSALAGTLYAGMTGAADPTSGLNYLLPAFAAVFLGATSITPGRFNPWGSFIAVYLLVSGITGLTMLGIDTFVQNLFYGGALVLAVAASQLVRNRQALEFS